MDNILQASDREKLLSELLDPNRTVLYCGKHFYSAGPNDQPAFGCVDCQKVYWISEVAKYPPHERRERLERLQETVHHFVEAVQRGEWDVQIDEHPTIENN